MYAAAARSGGELHLERSLHCSLLEMFFFAQNRIAVDVLLHHKTGQVEMESHSTAGCTAVSQQ